VTPKRLLDDAVQVPPIAGSGTRYEPPSTGTSGARSSTYDPARYGTVSGAQRSVPRAVGCADDLSICAQADAWPVLPGGDRLRLARSDLVERCDNALHHAVELALHNLRVCIAHRRDETAVHRCCGRSSQVRVE
jgi:hypothetical protein